MSTITAVRRVYRQFEVGHLWFANNANETGRALWNFFGERRMCVRKTWCTVQGDDEKPLLLTFEWNVLRLKYRGPVRNA